MNLSVGRAVSKLVVYSRGRFVKKKNGRICYYDNDGTLIDLLAEKFGVVEVFGRVVNPDDDEYTSASQYSFSFSSKNVNCFFYSKADSLYKKLMFSVALLWGVIKSDRLVSFGPSYGALLLNFFGVYKKVLYYSGLDWTDGTNTTGLKRFFESASIRCATSVLCTGEHLRIKYSDYGQANVEPVKPPLKVSTCVIPRDKFNCDEVLRIISVGAISSRKNQDLLINAIYQLRVKHQVRVKLVICGLGDLDGLKRRMSKLLSVLDGDVEFKGHVANAQELEHQYQSSDVICITSNREGVPRAMYEGIKSGLAVISTPLPGVTSFMGPGAMYFDYSDVHALVSRILEINENRDLLERLGRDGQDRFSEFFSESSQEMFLRMLEI